ncbi:MAG: CDP-diacylglycerol--serine O-phosphatidyltransferase [Mucinivorans sp.]
MKNFYSWIPNALTSCNLLCGCLAITFVLDGSFELAFWAVMVAAIFDFFDGLVARMLKAYSPLGADLDSLADMVSFGVAPAMAVFALMQGATGAITYLNYCAFLLAVFAALRLAKFNIDTRQSEEFRGLPTPAMSMFFMSLAVVYGDICGANSLFGASILGSLVALFCGLMVCDMPMFSFKFKTFSIKKNLLRYIFAIISVIIIVWFSIAGVAIVILIYILIAMTLAVLKAMK